MLTSWVLTFVEYVFKHNFYPLFVDFVFFVFCYCPSTVAWISSCCYVLGTLYHFLFVACIWRLRALPSTCSSIIFGFGFGYIILYILLWSVWNCKSYLPCKWLYYYKCPMLICIMNASSSCTYVTNAIVFYAIFCSSTRFLKNRLSTISLANNFKKIGCCEPFSPWGKKYPQSWIEGECIDL